MSHHELTQAVAQVYWILTNGLAAEIEPVAKRSGDSAVPVVNEEDGSLSGAKEHSSAEWDSQGTEKHCDKEQQLHL